MDKILKEQIENIIKENEIFITIKVKEKDKNTYEYNNVVDIELQEYIRNKEQYKKDFLKISFINKNRFNEIQSIELELVAILNDYFYKLTDKEKFGEDEDGLNNHINALVEEHMKLYDIQEIQNYMKRLLNI